MGDALLLCVRLPVCCGGKLHGGWRKAVGEQRHRTGRFGCVIRDCAVVAGARHADDPPPAHKGRTAPMRHVAECRCCVCSVKANPGHDLVLSYCGSGSDLLSRPTQGMTLSFPTAVPVLIPMRSLRPTQGTTLLSGSNAFLGMTGLRLNIEDPAQEPMESAQGGVRKADHGHALAHRSPSMDPRGGAIADSPRIKILYCWCVDCCFGGRTVAVTS